MESRITLNDMHFYSYHGVLPQEAVTGTGYTVNIQLHTDIARAMASDALPDTIDYSAVYTIVKAEMQQPSKLLEHVCGRIVRHIFSDFSAVEAIDISIDKSNPPMAGADIRSAGVRLSISRGEAEIVL